MDVTDISRSDLGVLINVYAIELLIGVHNFTEHKHMVAFIERVTGTKWAVLKKGFSEHPKIRRW